MCFFAHGINLGLERKLVVNLSANVPALVNHLNCLIIDGYRGDDCRILSKIHNHLNMDARQEDLHQCLQSAATGP